MCVDLRHCFEAGIVVYLSGAQTSGCGFRNQRERKGLQCNLKQCEKRVPGEEVGQERKEQQEQVLTSC